MTMVLFWAEALILWGGHAFLGLSGAKRPCLPRNDVSRGFRKRARRFWRIKKTEA
jgi:hypothetical protein